MLERLTVADFAPLIGTRFTLVDSAEGDSQTLSLRAATAVGSAREPGMRGPFALHFLAPGSVVLPQAIYRLESDALPPLEIFLVPIGQNAEGVTYEAIFS